MFTVKYTQIFYLKIYLVLISLGIIFIYLYNFYTANGDILVYTHDVLDSYIAHYKLLSDTNTFFVSNTTFIPNIMNGIPRAALPNEYSVIAMLYYFFTPAKAYIINETIIRLIAFTGMFFLLQKNIFKKTNLGSVENLIVISGTALIFSLLPYHSNMGISIAGQPFVLYAFLNIKSKDLNFKNWLILALFPFYSSLIHVGMFVLALLTIIALFDWIKNRAINYYLFLSILMMSILYLLVSYRLVINMLDPIFISHRIEFGIWQTDYSQSLMRSAKLFFIGQYHTYSLHGYFLIPFIFATAIVSLMNKKIAKYFVLLSVFLIFIIFYFKDTATIQHWGDLIRNYLFNPYKTYYVLITSLIAGIFLYKKEYISFYLLICILSISLFSGFYDYIGFRSIRETFPILTQIQFDRFYKLFALLWFLLFAFASKILLRKTKFSIFLIILILLSQIAFSFKSQNANKGRQPIGMNYYYSENVYNDIRDFIHKPTSQYRIMSIGLNPAIAIYNGFYTLDAYLSTYPIEYKHEFRKIIAPQLAKSDKNTQYFDIWANRCRLIDKSKNISLNLDQFKKMGGEYIFSAYKVNINRGKDIKYLNKFSDDNSRYDIYLYKVK